jgi:tryptophan synthase alpha subunit
VVVGSAIVRLIGELGDTPETAAKVGAYVQTLVEATKSATTA